MVNFLEVGISGIFGIGENGVIGMLIIGER